MINLIKSKNTGEIKKKPFSKAGFTLFVAMIVSSLLLAVGFSIGNIILKQLLLAGSGKDSQVAFYAADSGAECAQFWDTKNADGTPAIESPFFSTSTNVGDISSVINITCGAGTVNAFKVVSSDIATTTLIIDFSDNKESPKYQACARVVIEKGFTPTDVGNGVTENIPYTFITSRGYNAGVVPSGSVVACDTLNPRTVERGLFVKY